MGFPLYVICHFYLVSFNIFFFAFNFFSLITVYLRVLLLGFILPGPLCTSWTWLTVSSGKSFSYYLSKYFSQVLSLFSFRDPYKWMMVYLMCPRGLLGCLHLFSFSFLCSVMWQWFPPFCLPGHLSILLPVILLLISSSVFFISVILFFISVCLLFSSSR